MLLAQEFRCLDVSFTNLGPLIVSLFFKPFELLHFIHFIACFQVVKLERQEEEIN